MSAWARFAVCAASLLAACSQAVPTNTDADATAADILSATVAESGHDPHGYAPTDLAALGGAFVLENVKGGQFTDKDLLGKWSLVYLGYMECKAACPMAMSSLPYVTRELQASGVTTQLVFIDVNAPRLDDLSGGVHEGHDGRVDLTGADHRGHAVVPANAEETGPKVRARLLAEWAPKIDPDMIVLAGSRKQIRTAMREFEIRVEPNMSSEAEPGHRINHTSNIFIMDPDGNVAGLVYHDTPPADMLATVRQLVAARQPS